MASLHSSEECLKNLEHMKKIHHQKPTVFQNFMKSFTRLIMEVEEYMVENKCRPTSHKSKIILCLSQLKKVLPMLHNIIKENEEHGVKEKIWYLCERIQWCISELGRMLRDIPDVKDTDTAGTFVNHTDHALQLLSLQQGVPSPIQWKSIIDNLLCQALTIAKISDETDFKEITAISQKVLQESNELIMEIKTDKWEASSIKHMCESLAGDLITLEQRVNTAVLRLVLQVFSDSNKPLRNLISICGRKDDSEKSLATFESIIDDLDTCSERIHHIGTFAIACSEDNKRINGIRCCLASLESLDNYLVPAATAFFYDNQHPSKREFIKFLTCHWQQEIASLQVLLDGIIDTSAFCQVCYEDICGKIEKLKESILDEKQLDKVELNTMIGVGEKLLNHLEYNKTSINVDSQLIQGISIALHECNAANQLYLSTQSIDTKSLVKRWDLLLASIQKLVSYFSRIINSSHAFDLSSLVEFPDSIKDLPLDISENANSSVDHNQLTWLKKKYLNLTKVQSNDTLEELKPYLSCVVERNNTFYVKTPCKSKINIPAVNIDVKDTAMATQEQSHLDISDILDNLTSLSDTLTSTITTSNKSRSRSKLGINNSSNFTKQDQTNSKEDLTKYKILSSCLHNRMSSVSAKTGEVSDFNTPERLQDLKNVEAKIEMLKLGDV